MAWGARAHWGRGLGCHISLPLQPLTVHLGRAYVIRQECQCEHNLQGVMNLMSALWRVQLKQWPHHDQVELASIGYFAVREAFLEVEICLVI